MQTLKVVVGCDHAGLDLAHFVCAFLEQKQAQVTIFAPPKGQRVDYPDFAYQVIDALKQDCQAKGVLVCGSGIGMSIACNRVAGMRAALCTDAYMARMARLHNDANVLCLGQNVIGFGVAQSILEAFFSTEFEGGRHALRLAKLEGQSC
ncbi:ribose 5-phosphate isomerase B [Helicobacter bizzozeronii]|uniref:ribose 5-phosphate isomerase B n=1 Tax=Helicobacter bizzozeronii TaxID=56877 RepID=UPI00024E5D87|nr:ribose 5-phosphate isomerase B [Helicobacter bizzozeronii]CCF81758.1 Ribose 5-phosphate isomerase B [Helicobacter bizzozeronii CCUG 35545]